MPRFWNIRDWSFVSKEEFRGKIEMRCWSKRAYDPYGLSFGDNSDLSINMKPFDNEIWSASRNGERALGK